MPRKRNELLPRAPLWAARSRGPRPAGHPGAYMVGTALLLAVVGALVLKYGQRAEVPAFAFFSINELWKVVLVSAAPLLTWILWWLEPVFRQLRQGAAAVSQRLRRA